jgi:hypothetical protein
MNALPTPTVSPLILRGRIAFATFRPGALTLDGVLEPGSPVSDYGVFSLHVVLPYSTWAVAAAGLVDTWAACDAAVELLFRYSSRTHQVRISDGSSFVLFDLECSPTLRIGPTSETRPPICA